MKRSKVSEIFITEKSNNIKDMSNLQVQDGIFSYEYYTYPCEQMFFDNKCIKMVFLQNETDCAASNDIFS